MYYANQLIHPLKNLWSSCIGLPGRKLEDNFEIRGLEWKFSLVF